MAKYVFAYTGGSTPQSEDEQAQVMAAWTGWFGELGAAIVDPGNPFGASKSVGDGASPGLTGYSVVNADSLDAAATMAQGCPVLNGGGSVEVYEAIEVM